MTEPWQIHVCPVHGQRTPNTLGDCPVGCCAEVMEVVPVVRDTRGDSLERYRALAEIEAELKVDEREIEDEQLVKLACAYNDGIRDALAAVQQHDQGAVYALAKIATVRDPPQGARGAGADGHRSRHRRRGQSTAEEAFEQSSGGETLEEAQSRQFRGEHAFSPQPETRGAVDEKLNDGETA